MAASAQYTAEQMTQMLTAGAAQIDRYPTYAAIHLLTFTALPHRPNFATFVEVEDTDTGPVAVVRDWTALPTDRLGSGDARLIALAVSLATGTPVDLREHVAVGGHAYARRVIEAIAIATGTAEFYTVTDTPALAEMLAARDALFS